MDSLKKRRNSILKKICEDDNTATEFTKPANVQKRRISFCGKKSVRVFSGEEEPQAWDNSYDESDNAINASVESEHTGRGLVKDNRTFGEIVGTNVEKHKEGTRKKSVKIAATHLDKENLNNGNYHDQYNTSQLHQYSSANLPVQAFNNSSGKIFNKFATSLHTTADFIENTHGNGTTLHIGNSIEISLYKAEIVRDVSYSFEEHEMEYCNKPINGRKSANSETSITFTSILPNEKKFDTIQSNTLDCGTLNRKTICEPVNLEISESHFDKALQPAKNNVNLKREQYGTTNMQVENMDLSTVEQKCDSPLKYYNSKQCNELADCAMDITSRVPHEYNAKKMSIDIAAESAKFDKKLTDINLHDQCDFGKNTEQDFKRFLQQENNDVEAMDISIHAQQESEKGRTKGNHNPTSSDLETLHIEPEIKNIDTTVHFADQSAILPDVSLKTENCDKQKTVIFGNLEMSHVPSDVNVNKRNSDNRKTILFGDTNASELNISNAPINENCNVINKVKDDNVPESCSKITRPSSKGAVPKVVVVRKICTPNQKQTSLAEFKLNRYQRFHLKQKEMENQSKLQNEPQKVDKRIDNNNLGSPNLTFEPFSPPLIPHEYISNSVKKYNFRQLNDDIEQGIIKIFPEDDHPSSITIKNKKKCSNIDDSLLFSSASIKGLQNTKKTIFSEEEDMQLDTDIHSDNKLGDATNLRCTSKESANIRRNTLYFHSDIDMEIEEKNHIEPDEKTLSSLTQECRQTKTSSCKRTLNKKKSEVTPPIKIINTSLKETFGNSFTQTKSQRSMLNEINEMEIDVSLDVCALEKINQENSDSFKITLSHMKPNKDEKTPHHVSNLPQRRTLIFHQNDDIDCDLSLVTPIQVISEPTTPLQNLHSLENINGEKTDLIKKTNIMEDKTEQLKDCELSKFGGQTLIFNMENNDLQNELSFENDYQEKVDSFKEPIETSPNNFEITIEPLKQIPSPLPGSQTVIFSDEHDMDCDISQNKERQNETTPLKNNLPVEMMQNNVPPTSNLSNISETPTHWVDNKLPIKRLTCYYNDNDNIDLENSVQSKVENNCNNNRGRQTLYFNSAAMDETKVNCEETRTYKSLPSRQTLHFTEGNDMDLENSIVASNSNNTELVKIAPTPNILNVAKHTLFKQFRHIGKDAQTLDGSVIKQRNNQCTTEKYMEMTPLRTPHRSLIEFEYLEMTTKFDEQEKEVNRRYTNYETSNIKFDETEEIKLKAEKSGTNFEKVDAQRKIIFSNQDSQHRDPELVKSKILEESGLKSLYNDKDMEDFPQDKCISPRIVEIGKKRTPINLTPNLPDAKKRQTISYNCDMEVSFVASDSFELSNKNQKYPNRKTIIFSDEMKNADEYDQKIVVDDSIINIQNDTNITFDTREEYAKTKTSNCLEIEPKKNDLNLDFSDTIEIPRRVPTLFNLEKSLQYEGNTMGDNSASMRKLQNIDTFEEPITISDVSVFYQSQRKVPDVSCVQINNIAMDEHAEVELISSEVCEDNTVNNIAKIKKLFINLPCDSPILGLDSDQIENTSMSLVRTQDDVDDDDVKEVIGDLEIKAQEDIQGRVLNKQSAICTQPTKISYESLRNTSIMCRKCKRCQESFLNETSTSAADSFVLPTLPPDPDIGMDELLKQRQRPTISDVTEYWQRKSLECSFNIEEWSFGLVTELDVDDTDEDADALIAQYEEKFRRNELHYAKMQTYNMKVSFVKRLKTHIRSSNWIFDYQLQIRKFYEFLHRKIVTFSLVVHFLPIDPMGIDVNIAEVEIKHSRIPRKNWKPMHFVLDFQLKIELPYDLSTLYHSTDAFHNMVEMLNAVDGICINVNRLGHQLWKLVFKHNASIIREANATFVRKVVRKIVSNEGEYRRIQKTEFKIEITNIRKISYKDIISPPLHLFREDIQYLPLGLDFLGEFLRDPMVLLNT